MLFSKEKIGVRLCMIYNLILVGHWSVTALGKPESRLRQLQRRVWNRFALRSHNQEHPLSWIGMRGVKLENLWNVGEFVSVLLEMGECVLKVGEFADFTHHVCGNGFSIYVFIEKISPLSLIFFFWFWIHTPSAPSTAGASTDGGAVIRKPGSAWWWWLLLLSLLEK